MTSILLGLLLVTQSKTPGLDKTAIAKLATTKQVIYLPTWIPAGFVGNTEVSLDKQPALISYSVTYTKGKQSFTIQSASEGIGDIFLENETGEQLAEVSYPVKLIFGKTELVFDKKTKTQFVLNWQEASKKQMPLYIGMFGRGIEPKEAIKIVQSVTRSKKIKVGTIY